MSKVQHITVQTIYYLHVHQHGVSSGIIGPARLRLWVSIECVFLVASYVCMFKASRVCDKKVQCNNFKLTAHKCFREPYNPVVAPGVSQLWVDSFNPTIQYWLFVHQLVANIVSNIDTVSLSYPLFPLKQSLTGPASWELWDFNVLGCKSKTISKQYLAAERSVTKKLKIILRMFNFSSLLCFFC